jgi:hypothetical protein
MNYNFYLKKKCVAYPIVSLSCPKNTLDSKSELLQCVCALGSIHFWSVCLIQIKIYIGSSLAFV